MRVSTSIILLGLFIVQPYFLRAQQQLQPLWQHTWGFGQDDPQYIAPAGRDNHVVVDPITGLVHCTVDDQNSLYSDRGELFFTFDPSGQELTPLPTPLVGHYSAIEGMGNANGTMDMAVYDGRIFATQFRRTVNYDFVNHVVGERSSGSLWVTSPGLGAPGPNGFQNIDVKEEHIVLAGPKLMVFEMNGWFRWQTDQAGQRAYIYDGIVHSIRNGEIRRFDLVDGDPLAPVPVTAKRQCINGISWRQYVLGPGDLRFLASRCAYITRRPGLGY